MKEAQHQKFVRLGPKAFKREKTSILSRIVPLSIVPMSTANVMLVMGTSKAKAIKGDKACDYPLPQALLISGTVSLGFVVMGVVAKHVLEWIVENRFITKPEQWILLGMERFGTFLAITQVALCAYITYILVKLWHFGFQDEDKSGNGYCEKGIVIFTTLLTSIIWICLLIGFSAFVYVQCIANKEAQKDKNPV